MAEPQNVTSTLFEPKVFQALVDELEPARGLMLYNAVPKEQTHIPMAQWTVKYGSWSEMAKYNTMNSKANLVDRQGGQAERSSGLAYIREGDFFTPTSTMFLRDMEDRNDPSALVGAEKVIADQVAVVNDRIDNRIEWSLWQALQGSFEYHDSGHQGSNAVHFTVDYGYQDSHKETLAETWDSDTARPDLRTMIQTLVNFRKRVARDGGVPVTEVYLTSPTFELIMNAFTDAAVSDTNRLGLTDTMINQYYATGEIKAFLGADTWKVVDQYYDVRSKDNQSVTTHSYIPHGTIVFGNTTANSPLKYKVGPSADFSAPSGHIGRFAKNWVDQDPSGRQFLIEESGLPILDRPDQFGTLKVASDTWAANQTW